MLGKNTLLNLALLAVFIGLGILVATTNIDDDNKLPLLTDIDPQQVSAISITHNQRTTELRRQADDWIIDEPVRVAANSFRIESLLKLLQAPVHSSYARAEIDTAAVGLDDSATRVAFGSTSIRFGIRNPATELRYVAIADMVYTIEDVYFPLLSSHYSTLVAFELLPADFILDRLILLEQTISKDEAGRWRSNIDATADQVAERISSWQNARAFGVHRYLERDMLGEIFAVDTSGNRISFVITDNDPWLILARPELDIEYHLEVQAWDRLVSTAP